jgi:glycosyltransferase involved in cell wall biosynthesis
MQHTHESISVAIPVYNDERYLGEALRSVLAQSLPPTETLVFDNCSTDGSREVAATVIPRSDIRESAANLGAVNNFNRAARESTGTFFAWLASDDRLHPQFLERCVQALRESPLATACLPGVRFIDLAGRSVGTQSDPTLGSPDPRTRLRSFLRRPRWTESYCVYRRDDLLASPIFQDEYGADVLLAWWFLIRGPFVVVDEPLLEYRVYPDKSVADMAVSLNPSAGASHWRKTRLWRQLWKATSEPGVDRRARQVARLELIACLWHRDWVGHFYEDVRLWAAYYRTVPRR